MAKKGTKDELIKKAKVLIKENGLSAFFFMSDSVYRTRHINFRNKSDAAPIIEAFGYRELLQINATYVAASCLFLLSCRWFLIFCTMIFFRLDLLLHLFL